MKMRDVSTGEVPMEFNPSSAMDGKGFMLCTSQCYELRMNGQTIADLNFDWNIRIRNA